MKLLAAAGIIALAPEAIGLLGQLTTRAAASCAANPVLCANEVAIWTAEAGMSEALPVGLGTAAGGLTAKELSDLRGLMEIEAKTGAKLTAEEIAAIVGPAATGAKGSGLAGELTGITQKQLDKKFKHASDFGVVTTKKNPETLAQYETAIKNHMESSSTSQQGTYGFVKDSKVFFNSTTNNAVVLDSAGNFVTGFKLSPNTQQFDNFIKNGVLR